MAGPKGLFDPLLVPEAWFSSKQKIAGWFDDTFVSQSLTTSAGSYTITGSDATLIKFTAARTIAADTGSYAITGSTSALKRGLLASAAAGSYALTGSASTLKLGRLVASSVGSYSVTGSAASLKLARLVSAAAGTYTITGLDATMVKSSSTVITADPGSYVITGSDADLSKTTIAVTIDRGDVGGGKEWRNAPRQKRYQFDGRKFNEVLASVPDTPPTSRKAKKKLAKQIIVAAGDSDIIPYLAGFGDELQQIGTAAIEAAQAHSITQAQAHYSRILAIIDQIEAQIAEDEADEDDVIEQFLLAA